MLFSVHVSKLAPVPQHMNSPRLGSHKSSVKKGTVSKNCTRMIFQQKANLDPCCVGRVLLNTPPSVLALTLSTPSVVVGCTAILS